MKITVEVSDLDLLDYGIQAIEQELQDSLKWIHLRRNFTILAQGLQANFEVSDYAQELTQIRHDSWQIYKQDLNL